MRLIKGKKVTLKVAKTVERKLIYEMALSTDYMRQRFAIDFPNGLKSFEEEYCDEFFDNRARSICGGMMIYLKDIPIGFISYSSKYKNKAYLNPKVVELDIWLDGEKNCSKGLGSDAIAALTSFLFRQYRIHTFIICPEKINPRAVRAYEKSGFTEVKIDEKQNVISKLFVPEMLISYASELAAFYLSDGNVFMVKGEYSGKRKNHAFIYPARG